MDCYECDNKGYLEAVLNTKDNVIETQRCDNCQVFKTDEDARQYQEGVAEYCGELESEVE